VTACRILGLMLAAAIGCLPIAPPEHVHEGLEHGVLHVTVHRHAQFHVAHHEFRASGRAVLDDDDDSAIYQDSTYIAPAKVSVAVRPVSLVLALIQPVATEWQATHLDYVERLIHGPPRATASLRAPPILA
jgi:hypothetical protein